VQHAKSAIILGLLGIMALSSGSTASAAGTKSSNWSGYAITGNRGAYTAIDGKWNVPTVKNTTGTFFAEQWIGIDGLNNTDSIRVGTQVRF
jgi:hypothetical protein